MWWKYQHKPRQLNRSQYGATCITCCHRKSWVQWCCYDHELPTFRIQKPDLLFLLKQILYHSGANSMLVLAWVHMWTSSHLLLFVLSRCRWLYGVGVMALPTLQPYYMTRKGGAQPERLIVQRRTHESDVKQKWAEHSRYFHSSEVQSLKQEAWTSNKSFQDRYMCPFWWFNSPLLSGTTYSVWNTNPVLESSLSVPLKMISFIL